MADTGSPPTSRRAAGGLRKGDRRRIAILDATERLLHERSIAELSVESVAEAAGISRSGFYFYFDNKYAALGEALRGVLEEMTAASDDFFSGSEDPPRVYLPRTLRRVAELWNRHEQLLVGLIEAAATDPGARTLWDAWLDHFTTATAARIEVERSEGRAPPGPPAPRLARALLLMNERVFYDNSRRRLSAADREQMFDAVTGVWLAALWGERPDAAEG